MKGGSSLPDEERGGVPKIPSAVGFSWPGGTVWPAGKDCVTASGVRAGAGSSGMIGGVWLFELAIAPTQGETGTNRTSVQFVLL